MNKFLFVKEADFAEYAKGQVVKHCVNQYIKEVGKVDIHIIPTDEVITFKKMTRNEVEYYIGKVDGQVYEGFTKISGWFPTGLVCGTVNGCYSHKTELAKETGWLPTNGSFGSKYDAFLATGVRRAAEILEAVGFKVVFI